MRFPSRLAFVVSALLFGSVLPVSCAAGELNDPENFRWDIQGDGSIGDGNNDTFDGGVHLLVNGQRFNGGRQQFGADPRETVIGPQDMGGFNVTRKIRVSEKMPGCRFLEIVQNTSGQPLQVVLSIYTNVGSSIQGTLLPDSNDARFWYACVDQGQGNGCSLAYCMAPSKGKLQVQCLTQDDNITLTYDPVTLKPNERMAIVHVCAQRNSVADAESFARKLDWAAVLRELDRNDRALVRNVRSAGGLLSVGGVELFHGEGGDAIRLNSGELLTGTIETPAFSIETEFGPREIPAAQVFSLFPAGTGVRLVCQNGEVLSGQLKAPSLRLKLRGGRVLDVPAVSISKYGKRMPQAKPGKEHEPPDEEAVEQFAFADPLFVLRNGDRLVGKPVGERWELNTLYGPLSVGLGELRRIDFPNAELRAPLVTLADGSSFTALPQRRQWELKTAGGATVALDAGRLAAVYFRPAEDLSDPVKEEAQDPERPMLPAPNAQLRLANQDVFCGTLDGPDGLIVFETPFGTQRIGVHQVMRLKPRKMGAFSARVTLWDGNVFPARPVENVLRFITHGGAKLEVPFGMLELYWRPLALPPAEETARIEGLIAKLSDNDPQAREEAQRDLAEMGHGIRALLAKHWKDEDLERRTRVRRLMERLQESAPQETLEDEEDDEAPAPVPAPMRSTRPVRHAGFFIAR